MSWCLFVAALYSPSMATISRVRVAWQNWPGAPGVSTFFTAFSATQAQIDGIRAFYNALAALLPSGLTITVPPSGDNIDDATGQIVGSWGVGTPPAVVTGTGAGNYAGNAGACVHWTTNSVLLGRRVKGTTFLVPLVSTAFATDGSIGSATLTTIQTAASGLVTALATNGKVWSRKTPFRQGSSYTITGSSVPDLAISLRSRRV